MENQLYQKVLDFINGSKQQKMQFKPSEHEVDLNQKLSRLNIDAQLETIKKEKSNKIDHQIYNICENIVFTFFGLSNQKFYAIIQRSKFWGLQLCIEQFIMDYYLLIKQNNRLRQFIMIHFHKIVLTVCSIIEAQLIEKINLQEFTTSPVTINTMKSSLKQKEQQLKKVSPSDLKEQAIASNVKSETDAAKLKQSILADLKAQNKILEEI